MRVLFFWFLACLLMLTPAQSDFRKTETPYLANHNLVKNPGFEQLKTGYSTILTGGATFNVATTNAGFGSFAANFDAAVAVNRVSSNAIVLPSGLKGNNCMAEMYYMGGDNLLDFEVREGSNLLCSQTLAATTTYKRVSCSFVCPTSGDPFIRISATGDAAIIYFDEMYLGENKNISDASSLMSDWQDYTPTGSWTSNVAYFGKWRRVGDTMEVEIAVAAGVGVSTGELIVDLPSGFTIDTSKINAANVNAVRDIGSSLVDGTGPTAYTAICLYYDSNSVKVKRQYVSGVETQLSVVHTTTPFAWTSGDYAFLRFSVPITGWTVGSYQAITPDLTGWYVDVNIGGANPNLSATAETAYIGIDDAGLDMVINDGSMSAEIPCSSTNLPTGLTCSSGNESVGVAYNLPKAGSVEACFDFAHQLVSDVPGSIDVVFQVVETDCNSQTITKEGNIRMDGGIDMGSVYGAHGVQPRHVCGIFKHDSAGQKCYRLMYEQALVATVSSNRINAERAAGRGQRDIHVSVKPITQNIPMPVIIETQPVAARYTVSGSQVVANSALDIRDFDTKVFDTHNAVTTGAAWKFTAPVSGIYSVSSLVIGQCASGEWDESDSVITLLYKNGGSNAYFTKIEGEASPASLVVQSLTGTILIQLEAGDYIDLRIFNDTGVNWSSVASGEQNHISIHRIPYAGAN